MNRRSFGFWGVDLSTADFAAALAAAGVLAGNESLGDAERERHLLVWRSPLERLSLLNDARSYADRWKQYVAAKSDHREQPRIEIDPEFDSRRSVEALWVLETLSIPEVKAAAIYIRADEPVAKVVLEWPIRIGVLPTAASSLLVALREYYHTSLIRLVQLSDTQRECDVLLLPGSLKQSVAELASLPFNIRCDVAIVLGPSEVTPRNAIALVATVRSLTRSAGVALAPTAERSRLSWFWRFVDEISHNKSIDVALTRAVQPKSSVTFVASRLLAQWSLAHRIDLLREKIDEHADSTRLIVLSSRAADMLSFNRGEFEVDAVPISFPGPCRTNLTTMAKHLERSHELPWEHETDMATAAIELQETAAEVLSDSTALPEPRWIQAQVYAQRADASPVRVTDVFRWHSPHEVRVRVARADAEWIRGEGSFPPLPDDVREHLLTVVFFERQCMAEPQMGTILLPRRGDSSSISFFFKPGAVKSIEARITVLYQNRVLQTALLKGAVGQNVDGDGCIEVVTEAVVRPGMYGLGDMERGDAAIVLNEAVTGESGALKAGAGRASYVSLEGVKGDIEWFDKQLSYIADEPQSYDGLFATKTVKMLVAFAEHGVLLHQSLTDFKDFETLTAAERIQVVSAKAEARFPIEFVYDRELEDGVSSLCLHAEQALRTGKCENDVPPGALPGSVVCPLGFWGLRKVIERHVYDRDVVWPAGAEFSLQSIPIDGRKRLNVLKSAVLGATTRVDAVEAGGVARVRTALKTIYGSSSYALDKWNDWGTVVGNAPTLLVLLIHVEETNKLQVMEIGAGELLGAAQLVTKLKQQSLTTPPALVLLMGCETGAPNISYQGFVAQFRRGGAAAVISSGSTLLGRHVVPITEELLKQLQALSAGQKTSIGEGMRAIRRTMLADGMPMVLALTAYGDADWRLA